MSLIDKALYRLCTFLYGATERVPVENLPICTSPPVRGRWSDFAGEIRLLWCGRCGSLRINSRDRRGRSWASTYTHTALDSRVPRSPVRFCRTIVRGLAREPRFQKSLRPAVALSRSELGTYLDLSRKIQISALPLHLHEDTRGVRLSECERHSPELEGGAPLRDSRVVE